MYDKEIKEDSPQGIGAVCKDRIGRIDVVKTVV